MPAAQAARPRLLLIDNYDSFTYNLVQAFLVQGAEVLVHRNDRLTVPEARSLAPSHLCISPGPGMPADACGSPDMIEAFAGRIPVLGVCLGHQAVIEVFGGAIVRAPRLMHGKTSPVLHDGRELFAGLPNPFDAGRYHSQIAERERILARVKPGGILVLAGILQREFAEVQKAYEAVGLRMVRSKPQAEWRSGTFVHAPVLKTQPI